MNTTPLYPSHIWRQYFVPRLKGDPAKEPIAGIQSTVRAIVDAATKTGRPRTDFEVEEISESRYLKLKELLG